MADKEKYFIVKCPKCGAEYTIAEIFYPENLLGTPVDIIRDDNGRIIFIDGKEPELEEDWECEHCGTDFKVKLEIKPTVVYDKRLDFKDDFSVDINKSDKEVLF